MYTLTYIALMLLSIPYILWGIYLLRRRIGFNDEFSAKLEGATLIAVMLYLGGMIMLLRFWVQQETLLLIFSVLGLVISAFALYGHIVISLVSRLLVDLFYNTHDNAPDQPRFSAAEALAHAGDYTDALEEYLTVARLFPKHPEVYQRIAEMMLKLERRHEAVRWFARALRHAKTPEAALPIVYRLVYILDHVLEDRAGAIKLLEQFLHRFPKAPEQAPVRKRLESLMAEPAPEPQVRQDLERLSDKPIEQKPSMARDDGDRGRAHELQLSPMKEEELPSSTTMSEIGMSKVCPDAQEDIADGAGETKATASGIAPIEQPLNPRQKDEAEAPPHTSRLAVDSLDKRPLNDQHASQKENDPSQKRERG